MTEPISPIGKLARIDFTPVEPQKPAATQVRPGTPEANALDKLQGLRVPNNKVAGPIKVDVQIEPGSKPKTFSGEIGAVRDGSFSFRVKNEQSGQEIRGNTRGTSRAATFGSDNLTPKQAQSVLNAVVAEASRRSGTDGAGSASGSSSKRGASVEQSVDELAKATRAYIDRPLTGSQSPNDPVSFRDKKGEQVTVQPDRLRGKADVATLKDEGGNELRVSPDLINDPGVKDSYKNNLTLIQQATEALRAATPQSSPAQKQNKTEPTPAKEVSADR